MAAITALNVSIHVSHCSPGTSKRNTIEHRLSSFISLKGVAGPAHLRDDVNLISNTTSRDGLVVRARRSDSVDDRAEKVSALGLAETACSM